MIYFYQLADDSYDHSIHFLNRIEDGYFNGSCEKVYQFETDITVDLIVYHRDANSYIARVFLKVDSIYFFKCAAKSFSKLENAKRWLKQIHDNMPMLMMGMPEEEMI